METENASSYSSSQNQNYSTILTWLQRRVVKCPAIINEMSLSNFKAQFKQGNQSPCITVASSGKKTTQNKLKTKKNSSCSRNRWGTGAEPKCEAVQWEPGVGWTSMTSWINLILILILISTNHRQSCCCCCCCHLSSLGQCSFSPKNIVGDLLASFTSFTLPFLARMMSSNPRPNLEKKDAAAAAASSCQKEHLNLRRHHATLEESLKHCKTNRTNVMSHDVLWPAETELEAVCFLTNHQ